MKKIAIFDSGVETPEEIIMAAGFTPYRLFGDPTIDPEKANEHIPPTHCIWTRNLLEQALNGLPEDIVGIIGTHGCDRTNREFDIWLECLDYEFMFFLNSPRKINELALNFFINDIKEMILQLEETFNIKITNENISQAIKLMNEIRSMLKKISDLRFEKKLNGYEFHSIVKRAQQEDKKSMLEFLNSKFNELNQRSKIVENDYKNILLTGSEIDDTEFIKYIEDLGFHVIVDDLGVGTKYFWNTIDEEEDPITSIAKYHLSKPINSTKYPSYKRFEVIKNLATKYNVDGIINVAQKFCEPVLYDHPYMKKKCKELGIPYLFVEVFYNREAYKQLSTRFSAFAEMI